MESGQVTQADRSQWQRQAAGVLAHIADRHDWFPAINWLVTTVGELSGWTSAALPASEGRDVFTLWHEALGLDEPVELAGGAGEPGRIRAQGSWAAVPVDLTAWVLPRGRPGPALGTGMATKSPTYRIVQAARTLQVILERHADVSVIDWQVKPSGELIGHVTGTEGHAVFAAWCDALELGDMAQAPSRYVSCGEVLGVRVTISAAVARMDVQHVPGGDRRHVPRARAGGPVVPLLSPHRPDGQRLGPVL